MFETPKKETPGKKIPPGVGCRVGRPALRQGEGCVGGRVQAAPDAGEVEPANEAGNPHRTQADSFEKALEWAEIRPGNEYGVDTHKILFLPAGSTGAVEYVSI
jgi:hypothetical protein